jgi:hypothetical protein
LQTLLSLDKRGVAEILAITPKHVKGAICRCTAHDMLLLVTTDATIEKIVDRNVRRTQSRGLFVLEWLFRVVNMIGFDD